MRRADSCHPISHGCNASAFLAGRTSDWGPVPVCRVHPGLSFCPPTGGKGVFLTITMGGVPTGLASAPSDLYFLLTDRALVTADVDSQLYKASSTLPPHGCVPYPPPLRCSNASAFPPRPRCAVHRHRPRYRLLWQERLRLPHSGTSFSPLTTPPWAVLTILSHFTSTGTTRPSRSQTPPQPNVIPYT